jgi:cyclase
VKRTIYAICTVLLSLSVLACQRSKEATKEIGTKEEAPPEAPKTATGPVETTKSPAKPVDDSMKDAVIETTPVAGPIYMLKGRGGNIGVSAGDDGVVMVDDQFAPLAPKILDAVRALGKGEPEFVLNTHWHGDHTGGNAEFGAKASIVAHENVRKRLSTPQQLRGSTVEAIAPAGLPVVTFQQSLSLHMNGEEIRVIHFPTGHTDGDSVIFFTGSNVVHMGDHFFNGKFPFVDLESGGNAVQFAANVKAVLDQVKDDTKIIPGHGPLASKADLAAYSDVLSETIKIVQKGKKAGKSVEDLQKAGLPEKFASWGDGFIKTDAWIKTVYDSLKK